MSIGILFWFLMILWLISWFGAWGGWAGPYAPHISSFLLWILLALLGWHAFGPILHG
jgi:hypothetical protein